MSLIFLFLFKEAQKDGFIEFQIYIALKICKYQRNSGSGGEEVGGGRWEEGMEGRLLLGCIV